MDAWQAKDLQWDPRPTLDHVFTAFIGGMHGLKLSDGNILTCSDTINDIDKSSDAVIPYLHLTNGSIQSTEWQRYVYLFTWDIQAELKIRASAGDANSGIRRTVDDLLDQVSRLRGLYVDQKYKVYPYNQATLDAYHKHLIKPLATRGGPILQSFRMRPVTDSSFAIADLVFRVAFLDEVDPTIVPPGVGPRKDGKYTPSFPVTAYRVGTIPRAPDNSFPLADPYKPFADQVPNQAQTQDTVLFGRQVGSDVLLPDNLQRHSPPFTDPNQPMVGLQGVNYQDLVKELTVNPTSQTIVHGNNFTITAIAIQISGASQYVTTQGTWTSSAPSIATVNSVGLVSALTAGSTNITVSYGGASKVVPVTVT